MKLVDDDLVEINKIKVVSMSSLVRVCKEKQVVDQRRHANCLYLDRTQRCQRIGTRQRIERDVDLGSQSGERAPQFMRRVADEPLLLDRRGLEEVEHVVHGDRKSRHLITRLGDGDPLTRI